MAHSKAQQLEAVENAIFAIMDGGAVQDYSIGGRSLSRMSLKDLTAWRDQLKAEIASENGSTYHVTFKRPN